jgi:hypothetical protein
MLDSIWQVFRELHFQYTEQFLVALPPMMLTVVLHGYGMRLAGRSFKRFGLHPRRKPHEGPHVILLIAIVAIMLATHYVEASAWALYYFVTDILPRFKEAMFYSINAYTTLGASNITLPERWKGIDGFEAITAMLMFGWSTAVLAAVVQKAHSIDD